MSTFESNAIPIKKLYDSISVWIDEKIFMDYFSKICDEFDRDWNKDSRKNHWKSAKVRVLLHIHERLELISHLKNEIGDSFFKRYKYPELITYLYLTCFDQLGQPSNWMTFDSWIKSSKKKQERQEAIEKANHLSKLEFAESLFNFYHVRYGVKNSFYKFLREILPKEIRSNLFDRIQILINDEASPTLLGRNSTEKDKEDYLFKARNEYTHNTFANAPILGVTKANKDGWVFRESVFQGTETHFISTQDNFEIGLHECVLIGISEKIKRNY